MTVVVTGARRSAVPVDAAAVALLLCPLAADRPAIMLDGEFREVVELGRRTVHDTAPLLERLGVHGL